MAKKAKKSVKPVEEAKQNVPATPEVEANSPSDDELEREIKHVEEEMTVIWHVRNKVFQKSSFIKTKTLKTFPTLNQLPEDIRKYLTNKGWGSNVYLKGEERLLKHKADMKMIEKLKKFLSDHYL